MHQPYYKHPDKNYYILPWVRLHGVKDYYGMAKIIEKFNKIKVVFNFSGVLIEQLLDYANNSAKDYYSILTLKNPSYLKKEEKDFIINRFFSVNFERFIRPNSRYLQLYNRKLSPSKKFSSQEIGDIQALFNLCWFHPYTFNEDSNLRELLLKKKNYTAEDKEYIIKKQYDILSQIIPLYKKLLGEGKIEVSTTPYYHPIMPLVFDTDVLKDSPYLKRPVRRFSAPSHCREHLKKTERAFRNTFGIIPVGSWPSEGGVSEDIISLYGREGFKWIATDESILFKSLITDYVSYDMIKNQRHLIYRPFKFKGVNIFFRDKNLSDAISFIYQGWEDPVFAANDLLEHFKRIHYYTKDFSKVRAITIIMDGENAWEYYKNNGVEFLETLYAALEKSHLLSATTPADFLKHYHPKRLDRVASGSWINGDFAVWAGSAKNNNYWHILKKIKDLIEKSKSASFKGEKRREVLERVENYLYILEGSDWFWWNSFLDESGEFKKIFFSYVKKIYHLLCRKVPSSVSSF
jgi:alpha-amylase/alpha-mannosidase (GH57 family)